MQFSKIIVSAFAAVAAAAPAISKESPEIETRSLFAADQLSAFNNFNFFNDRFAYFSSINGFDFNAFDANLFALQQQNFDITIFNSLFQNNAVLNVQNIVLLAQLQMVVQLNGFGLFNGFDLGGAQLFGFNDFGVLGNFAQLDLNQFIVDQTVITQVQSIASSSGLFGGVGLGGVGGVFKE